MKGYFIPSKPFNLILKGVIHAVSGNAALSDPHCPGKNHPLVLAIGTLEYHSEHLPSGVDGQITEEALKRLEKRHPEELILLPPFYYGASSYAVSGPENGKASIDIDSMAICNFAESLFKDLLEAGFRNINGFVYHQSENFYQGMPTDLAFRFAGRRAIFSYLERTRGRGRGWWGDNSMRNYYEGDNIFDSIRIHALAKDLGDIFGGDHAGKVETSAMMELFPHLVHMEKHNKDNWYAESALEATAEFGKQYMDAIVDKLDELLFGGR